MLSRMKVPVLVLFCGLVAGVAQTVAVPVANASGGSDHGNTVTVVVTTQSRTPGRSGATGTGSTGGHENVYVCTYTDAPPSMTTGLMTGGPEAGQFYIVSCTGPGLGSGQSAIVWLANQVYGVLEGVTPTLTYYAGSGGAGANLGGEPPKAPGTHSVIASFVGSADFAPTQSAPVDFTISRGEVAVVLASTASAPRASASSTALSSPQPAT